MDDLGKLWRRARTFGKVKLYTFDDGRYWCTITFNTIAGVLLEAESGNTLEDPESAVAAAISKAEEIIKSLTKETEQLTKLIGK